MRFEKFGHQFHTARFKYVSGKLGGYSVIHTASKSNVVEDFKTMREAVERAHKLMDSWGDAGTKDRIWECQRRHDAQAAELAAAMSRL